MYRFMCFKIDKMPECLITHITNIRAHTTMYALMFYNSALDNERLITNIRTHTTMYTLMTYKTALVNERLLTQFIHR
jgi:hypothetical protein